LWKRIIVFTDLVLLRAVQASGDGQVASLGVDFRVEETLAAGNEAAVTAIAVIARTCIGVQLTRQHFEAGGIGARLDVDNFATPANVLAAGILADSLFRRDRYEVVAGNLMWNGGAAAHGRHKSNDR
jgi:hypothetical protein